MLNLSIVFPVYNEEKRLKKTLPLLKKFLKENKKKNVEIIFISDGSHDLTNFIIQKFVFTNSKKFKIRFIKYQNNIGKGYAIKTGVLNSKNKWILICDIDFSVHPNQFLIWKKNGQINQNYTSYFGSREHKSSKIKASKFRVFLGFFFKKIIKILFDINLSDTQCGFKVFNKSYSKKIFGKLKSYRFAFDIELILLLKKHNVLIKELPLNWSHKSGSKMSLIKDIPIMLFDLITIKFRN